jgi:hypothetical protein
MFRDTASQQASVLTALGHSWRAVQVYLVRKKAANHGVARMDLSDKAIGLHEEVVAV